MGKATNVSFYIGKKKDKIEKLVIHLFLLSLTLFDHRLITAYQWTACRALLLRAAFRNSYFNVT